MRTYDVTIKYELNKESKEDVIRVNANGKDKATKVALSKFDTKHKKDEIYLVTTTTNQIITDGEDLY